MISLIKFVFLVDVRHTYKRTKHTNQINRLFRILMLMGSSRYAFTLTY